ncbi:MAG: hypothetical protein JXB32_09765 [Deltaproteobacteria bacterium]|nr:hypothetical protein [Deltaproteobacteria bacterium]
MQNGTNVSGSTVRGSLVLLLIASVAASGFSGCTKDRKNLPFGATCDSDRDCRSDICLFAGRSSKQGRCTQPCDLDRNDCPTGTTCTTIAEHAGKSIPVCGEPPPLPFGPQGTGEEAMPPPIAPGARPTEPFPPPGTPGPGRSGAGLEPPPPTRPPPTPPPVAPAP